LWKHNHTIFVSVLAKETWQKQINACMPDSAVLYSKYREIKVPVLPSNERNEITFGYLGTLDANKNVETLIDCFSELSRGKLIVGGDGELLKILRHKALMSVRSEDIEFVGKVTDLNEFYSRINILVNLSLNESWGLVVPEAMSAGKCVVMTKNTGLTEIFTSGKECVFVDPRSKTEIVRVMNEMMSDENFRNMLVQNANETLRSLDMNGSFDEKILKIVG
jgi:glycosyltransferase involved in cell wall biosynthesis